MSEREVIGVGVSHAHKEIRFCFRDLPMAIALSAEEFERLEALAGANGTGLREYLAERTSGLEFYEFADAVRFDARIDDIELAGEIFYAAFARWGDTETDNRWQDLDESVVAWKAAETEAVGALIDKALAAARMRDGAGCRRAAEEAARAGEWDDLTAVVQRLAVRVEGEAE